MLKESKDYADKLDKEMLKNFQVPGFVNNQDFKNDYEAGSVN